MSHYGWVWTLYPRLICIGQGVPGCQWHANWVLIYFFHPDRSLRACTIDGVRDIIYVGDPQALQTRHVQSWTQHFHPKPAHSLVLFISVDGTPSTQSSKLETWKSLFMPSCSPPLHRTFNCQVLKLLEPFPLPLPDAPTQMQALIISHLEYCHCLPRSPWNDPPKTQICACCYFLVMSVVPLNL